MKKIKIQRTEVCKECGCTDLDCSQCIEKTGKPCYWVHNKYDLCSACVDYWCVKTLIKYFEYMNPDSGICNLVSILYYDKNIIDAMDSAELRIWLENNLPEKKYDSTFVDGIFSWKMGNLDARWYWLQSKLKELLNE